MKKLIYFLLLILLTNISWGQNGVTRVTVITHGFTLGGGLEDDWREFALRLRKKTGGTVYVNNPKTGQWEFLPFMIVNNEILLNGANGANEHKIFLYDWADLSNNFDSDGHLEAAADNLFAMLCNTSIGNIFDGSWNTHFIGHSRGNILLLQVAHRVAKRFPTKVIDQFTLLDPHPAMPMNDASGTNENNSLPGIYGIPSKTLFPMPSCIAFDKVNTLSIRLPSNVLKADEYYRQDGVYEGCTSTLQDGGDFDGIPVNGIGQFKRELSNSVLEPNLVAISGLAHSSVWQWYERTFDINMPVSNSDWFSKLNGFNKVSKNPLFNEDRNLTGYYYSKNGGGYNLLPNATNQISLSEMELRSANRSNNGYTTGLAAILNGNFQYTSIFHETPAWELNGGQVDNVGLTSNLAGFSFGSELVHSFFYIPLNAKYLKIRARKTNWAGPIPVSNPELHLRFRKGDNSKIGSFAAVQSISSLNFTDLLYDVPLSVRGTTGTLGIYASAPLSIEKITFFENTTTQLRVDQTENTLAASVTGNSYFDFPVDYDVNPSPLIVGVSPSSFKATITNNLLNKWSGILNMTWKKKGISGRGITLVSKGVTIPPDGTVVLDRGTQQIISEEGTYVLGIYANNDKDPIDHYYFYVKKPKEITSQSISITPSSSNFGYGNVEVNTTKAQSFTITNTSNANVSISNYVLTGTGFAQGTTTCCGTLAPNQSYTVNVIFQPNAPSAFSGNLQINGTFTDAPINISLSGTGTYAITPTNGCLQSSLPSVTIQSGDTDAPKQQFFTLTNTSQTGAVNVTGLSITGADASYFSYDANLFSIPSQLAPARATGFMVKFNNPQNSSRTYNANLVLTTSNTNCSTLTIPLTAVNTPSQVSWVAPEQDNTVEYFNGYAQFNLQWQGYIPTNPNGGTGGIDIQYTFDNGINWTSFTDLQGQTCTIGHLNNQINTRLSQIYDVNVIGKDVQFRIKPCYTNIPWQYSGVCHVIQPGQVTLKLISPNGYEVLTGGQSYDIKWSNLIGYKSLSLSYSTDNGTTYQSIATGISGLATYYRWQVPTGIKSSSCLVKVTAANIFDISDQTFTIQPALAVPITYSEPYIAPIGCGATPNGSISFRILGGQAPYYVLFVEAGLGMTTINANYVVASMNGLDKGFQTVVVTDANYNKASFTFFVPAKREYTTPVSVTNDICGGSKGSAQVNLTGDFPYPPKFTFFKNGTQIYTGSTGYINNVSAGFYSVNILDNEGCQKTESFFIDSSPGTYFPITPTITNTSCSGTTGAISLNVGTAQTPTYLWSNGATTQNLTALSAGQYSVNISDATGCVQTQKYEVFEEGGLVQNSLSYNPQGDYNCFKISQEKLYFTNYRTTTPQYTLGILDIQTNIFNSIPIPRLYNPTTSNVLTPKTLDVTDNDIYTVVDDYPNNSTTETHFIKINKSNNQIISRKIIAGQHYYAKIQFINGKLYALRTDKSIDIIDFANNTALNFIFPEYLYNFVFNATNNKLYLVGDTPLLFEFDITTQAITRTGTLSMNRDYLINLMGNTLFITGRTSGVAGTYIERFDLTTFNSLGTTFIRNFTNLAWGGSFIKGNRYLYLPTTFQSIDVFDTQTLNVNSIPVTHAVFDLEYSSTSDRIFINGRNSGMSVLINNKFDFTTAKTDVTCGSNNGSITLTIPNDGKTYTYLWSNGATTKDVSSLTAGSYTVTVTQTGGCAVKKTISIVELSGAFVATVSPNSGGNICPSTSLALASSAGQSYVWYKDNVVIPNATSQAYSASIAGNYKVVVTNSNNCTATSNIVPVTVIPNPVSNFTFTVSGNVATFTNTSTNGSQYLWSFGDNTTDTQFNPIKTYATSGGTFSVKLRTTNSCGNFNEITKSVSTSCTQMYTLKTGNWTDVTVWSCGRTPTITDNITISSGHTVTIPNGQTGFINSLILNGRLINNGRLKYKEL